MAKCYVYNELADVSEEFVVYDKNMSYELTIAFVNFNTPKYIRPLINSLYKTNPWYKGCVHIYDNGNYDINEGVYDKFIYHHVDKHLYDEFIGMKEPNDPGCRHFCSAKHCKTLQYIIDNTKTKYLLLCDSDIIFTKNFENLYDTVINENKIACGFIKKPKGYADRLSPWFSILNLSLMKEHDIKYYDENRMFLINSNTTHDTGASFLEDCKKNNLDILTLPDDNLYYIHYKGGSYSNQNVVLKWLWNNKKYWI